MKAQKVLKERHSKDHNQLPMLTVKVHDETKAILEAKASLHAQDNVSAWLRHAGKNYVPKPGEIISLKNY